MKTFPDSRTPPPFPLRHPRPPPLALPSRSRASAADLEQAAISQAELERILRQVETSLADRERAVIEAELKLIERTRDIDEMDALLRAREALIASSRLSNREQHGMVTLREAEALHHLRAELDRQEANLREAREALREREKFIEQSELRLFAKVQEQQEKEMELEQREENIDLRRAPSPAPAAPRDEFRE